MSQLLDALTFPLHGSRLIEASAGTGKTWTIAALYLRLVLGHGGEDGYRVVGTARDGYEAVAEAVREQPDVILLDLEMPHLDGIHALPHLLGRGGDQGLDLDHLALLGGGGNAQARLDVVSHLFLLSRRSRRW